MLKTIKTTKQLRLDELIKYVRENKENLFKECVTTEFKTEINKEILFIDNGDFVTADRMNIYDLYTVEVEEEITEDTEFELLVGVYFYDDVGRYNVSTFYNKSIDDVKDSEALYIYALINEKLELIWERDKHASN